MPPPRFCSSVSVEQCDMQKKQCLEPNCKQVIWRLKFTLITMLIGSKIFSLVRVFWRSTQSCKLSLSFGHYFHLGLITKPTFIEMEGGKRSGKKQLSTVQWNEELLNDPSFHVRDTDSKKMTTWVASNPWELPGAVPANFAKAG